MPKKPHTLQTLKSHPKSSPLDIQKPIKKPILDSIKSVSPKESGSKSPKVKVGFTPPLGTRDIWDKEYYERQGFFEKAQEVVMYYGFKPIETPMIEHSSLFARTMGPGSLFNEQTLYHSRDIDGLNLVLRPDLTIPVMRSYLESGNQKKSEPLLLYYSGPVFRQTAPMGPHNQIHQFGVEIIGSDKPVTDAIVIKTLATILEESGAKNVSVIINSVGDKESKQAYEKELRSFYKKRLAQLSPLDQERFKSGVFSIVMSTEPETLKVNKDLPESIHYLSTDSKKHLRRVLEHLEEFEICYQLSKFLIRDINYYSETVFELYEPTEVSNATDCPEEPIDNEMLPVTLASGGRYNYLAEALGHNTLIPTVGASLLTDTILTQSWWKHLTPRIIKQPKIYYIQISDEAKLKSLGVLEMLRKAKIPVYQELSKDSLSIQLEHAEKQKVDFAIIMGHKEALDHTVMIRNMHDRSQKTVPVAKLIETLNKMK